MKFFLNNIELFLSGIGVVVTLFIPLVFFPDPLFVWEAAALTAVIVSILHGMIFWFIRKRQRKVRDQAIKEIKIMLKDIVNNQLTTISLSAMNMEKAQLDRITTSVQTISTMINSLSEESLKNWRNKYEETLKSLNTLHP